MMEGRGAKSSEPIEGKMQEEQVVEHNNRTEVCNMNRKKWHGKEITNGTHGNLNKATPIKTSEQALKFFDLTSDCQSNANSITETISTGVIDSGEPAFCPSERNNFLNQPATQTKAKISVIGNQLIEVGSDNNKASSHNYEQSDELSAPEEHKGISLKRMKKVNKESNEASYKIMQNSEEGSENLNKANFGCTTKNLSLQSKALSSNDGYSPNFKVMEENTGTKEQEDTNRKDIKTEISDKRDPGYIYESGNVSKYPDHCEEGNRVAMETELLEIELKEKENGNSCVETNGIRVIDEGESAFHPSEGNENGSSNTLTTETKENTIQSIKSTEVGTDSSIPSACNDVQSPNPTSNVNPGVKTLEGALKRFGLSSHFQQFEKSLEDVRSYKKTKEEHESYFKQVDKKLERILAKLQLDVLTKKRSWEDEMAVALNTVRTILSILNRASMKEFDTASKYGINPEPNASLLEQESKAKSHVYEQFFKIILMKQNIIVQTCKFLEQSQCCVRSFLTNTVNDFEIFRDLALFHLDKCIEGYEKLLADYSVAQKECEYKSVQSIGCLISRMVGLSLRELNILKKLKEVATCSEKFKFFFSSERVESYFIFPFVCYINIISMCNLMKKIEPDENTKFEYDTLEEPILNYEISFLIPLYYLAAYFRGNNQYKSKVEEIVEREHVSKEEIGEEFRILLIQISEHLESELRVYHYKDGISKRRFLEECLKIIDDLLEHDGQKDAEGIEKENEESNEPHNKVTQDSEEVSENLDGAFSINNGKKTFRLTEKENTFQNLPVLKVGRNYNSMPFPYSNMQSPNPTSNACPDVKTLEDAFQYFGLSSRLEEFEQSLEDVRRYKKRKEAHESYLKRFDKEMQKLSFKHHPDRVRNRGGTAEEMAKAEKLQTALNATRKVLMFLTKIFLEDLDVDHKYAFYLKLNISSLGNEDELESHVSGVLFKINFISEIKQQKIIAEIRKFLIESKSCIKSYIDRNDFEFERYHHSAIYHLKRCIKGYEKLLEEYKAVEEECKKENMENVSSLIRNMKKDSLEQLRPLKLLSEIVNHSMKGKLQIFFLSNPLNDYFVLPFVRYMNLIIMCNAMTKTSNESIFTRKWREFSRERHVFYPQAQTYIDEVSSYFTDLYYLVLYYSGNNRYEYAAMKIMGKENASQEEIKGKFLVYVIQISEYLENNFKTDDYNERSISRYVKEELNICMRMMDSFQEKAKELSEGIREFKRDNKAMKEECDEIRKENGEFKLKLGESLEKSRKLREALAATSTESVE